MMFLFTYSVNFVRVYGHSIFRSFRVMLYISQYTVYDTAFVVYDRVSNPHKEVIPISLACYTNH